LVQTPAGLIGELASGPETRPEQYACRLNRSALAVHRTCIL